MGQIPGKEKPPEGGSSRGRWGLGLGVALDVALYLLHLKPGRQGGTLQRFTRPTAAAHRVHARAPTHRGVCP